MVQPLNRLLESSTSRFIYVSAVVLSICTNQSTYFCDHTTLFSYIYSTELRQQSAIHISSQGQLPAVFPYFVSFPSLSPYNVVFRQSKALNWYTLDITGGLVSTCRYPSQYLVTDMQHSHATKYMPARWLSRGYYCRFTHNAGDGTSVNSNQRYCIAKAMPPTAYGIASSSWGFRSSIHISCAFLIRIYVQHLHIIHALF